MNFNGKHLSLEDRKIIEQNICKGLRKFETAKELNKSQSTIGKEIKKNRKCKYSLVDTPPWNCKFFKDCMVCTSRCIHFEEVSCNRRDRFVGACNCCPNIKKCRKTKYFYYANVAQKNEKQSLLKYQIGSSLFFAAQYLFLQAYTGCLMNLTCALRNILFKKYDKEKVPIYLLIFIVSIMLILSLFSYTGPISLLPCIACILYTISIWQSNLKVTRIVEVISCSLYIIYNIKVLAYVGLISTIIELISALIAIYRFDIKKDYKS